MQLILLILSIAPVVFFGYWIYKKDFDKAVWGDDLNSTKSFKDFCSKYFKKIDGGYILKTNAPDPDLKKKYFKFEEKNWLYKEKMKDEALNLLKKYFYNLWD